MDELNKIIEKIKRKSDATIKEIMDNANNEAEDIRKKNEKETKKMVEKINQEYEKETTVIRNTIISGAKIEAKRTYLQIREEIIKDCFRESEKRLGNMEGTEYKKFLDRGIREGIDAVGKNAVVMCAEKDFMVIKKIVSTLNVSVDEKFLNSTGGVVVKSANEKIMVDNTFEGILNEKRGMLRKGMAEILFGE